MSKVSCDGALSASSDVDGGSLDDAILALSDGLHGVELSAMRGIMSGIALQLCPDGQFPSDQNHLRYLRSVIKVLASAQGHSRMTPNGILYYGRPSFMGDDLLRGLQSEARKDVRPRAILQRGHILGIGGTLADELARSEHLRDLVESCAGPVDATGVASYLFYEEEGQGIGAHVDTDIFSINVNICLWHESHLTRDSRLFIFHTNGVDREEYLFEPGYMMVTFGDSVIHGRSGLSAGESLANLTIGFQPKAWEQ